MRAKLTRVAWRRVVIAFGAVAIVLAGWLSAATLAGWRQAGAKPLAALTSWAGSSAPTSAGTASGIADPGGPAARPSLQHPVGAYTYAQWIAGHSDDWRIGRLASNPKILLIEFPTLAAQGQALNRIAALIEKRDTPRERVLDDAALAAAILKGGDVPDTYLFGHDYASDSLARFFALAQRQQVALNAQEQRLRSVLLAEGLWFDSPNGPAAPATAQALVTFTAQQTDRPATLVDESVDAVRRETILRHELSHGEFFTQPAYRAHCWAFWKSLSDKERSRFRSFLAGLDYEPKSEPLMVNETQAFLMHTPDERVFSASLLGVSEATLDTLRAKFRAGVPASIAAAMER